MSRHRRLAVTLLALALAAPALSQEAADGPSDKERLDAAREEQRKKQQDEEAAAQQAARTEEEEAERQRLEAIGATQADNPPEEESGFFVMVEASSVEITDADRVVARVGDVTAPATADLLDADGDGLPDAFTVGNRRDVTLAYGSEIAPRIELGYRRRAGGSFSLRYWSWSSTAEAEAASSVRVPGDPVAGDLILGGIDNQGLAATPANLAAFPEAFGRPFGSPAQISELQLHGADSVVASSELKARRIDLLFARTALARKRLEVGFRLGLTQLEVERTEAATFAWSSFARSGVLAQSFSLEEVETSAKTTGTGITVGINARVGLTANRRFSFLGALDVAGLSSSHETSFRDVQTFSQPGLPAQPPTVIQDIANDDGGTITTLLQGEVALEYRIGQRARIGVGYRVERWLDALTEQRFPSAANPAALEDEALDLGVSGPFLRVGVFF